MSAGIWIVFDVAVLAMGAFACVMVNSAECRACGWLLSVAYAMGLTLHVQRWLAS